MVSWEPACRLRQRQAGGETDRMELLVSNVNPNSGWNLYRTHDSRLTIHVNATPFKENQKFKIKKSVKKRQTIYFVPEAGLEPAYLAAHASETCVSTSSTIPVYMQK